MIKKTFFIINYVHMQLEIPDIPEEELTTSNKKLLNVICQCVQIIEQKNILIRQLKDENARLKSGNPRPKLRPSTLERNNSDTLNDSKKNNVKSGDRREKKKKKLSLTNKRKLKKPKVPEGSPPDLIVLSDDAGQFDVLYRALCWMHAERKINILLPINDYEARAIGDVRTQIWTFYNALKIYKLSPGKTMKKALEEKFDKIFTQKTEFESINKALSLIYATRKGLLMVLEKPGIPLHNNGSENTLRSMVQKRKIHGGTRSDKGKICRDTFVSLKKTCIKLRIPFLKFLYDRLTGKNKILPLYKLMLENVSI